MPARQPRRLTSGHLAVVLAALALFVAMGGPTHAANLITGKQIKNGSVTAKDIKDNSLKGADVKDEALTGEDISESTLGKVPSASAADAVADNAVTSAKVADRSLSAADVSLANGRVTIDLPSVPANDCAVAAFPLGANTLNLSKAAVLITPAAAIAGPDVSVTSAHSADNDKVRMIACNPTNAAVDPPAADFDWIAFTVAP